MLDDLLKKAAKPRRPRFRLRPELLLLPNIPKPLHGTAPRTVMGAEWWWRVKARALAKSKDFCVACGRHKFELPVMAQFLECHEVYKTDWKKGRMTYVEAVALCQDCHGFIHSGRLAALCEQGKLPVQEVERIIKWGESVLKKAKLLGKKKPTPESAVPWGAWRLVVGKKEFPGRFKDEDEWERFYAAAD